MDDNYNLDNNKFYIHTGSKYLIHGHEAKIEVSINSREDKVTSMMHDFPNATVVYSTNKLEDLEKLYKDLKDEEERVYYGIRESMQKWVDCSKKTNLCEKALRYKNTKLEKKNTHNQWAIDNSSFMKEQNISNNVYSMAFSIYENKSYNYKKGKEEKAFYVTWYLFINGINSARIAGQDNKRFLDKEKALKYIEGRKKAYKDYFQEDNPLILKEYARLFQVHGILLPGYRIKE